MLKFFAKDVLKFHLSAILIVLKEKAHKNSYFII